MSVEAGRVDADVGVEVGVEAGVDADVGVDAEVGSTLDDGFDAVGPVEVLVS